MIRARRVGRVVWVHGILVCEGGGLPGAIALRPVQRRMLYHAACQPCMLDRNRGRARAAPDPFVGWRAGSRASEAYCNLSRRTGLQITIYRKSAPMIALRVAEASGGIILKGHESAFENFPSTPHCRCRGTDLHRLWRRARDRGGRAGNVGGAHPGATAGRSPARSAAAEPDGGGRRHKERLSAVHRSGRNHEHGRGERRRNDSDSQ